jgi:L-lactate dehydrogenase complex protein LldG
MSSRETFLARVRQAAEQGRLYRVPLLPVREGIGYVGAEGDLCERFAAEVNAVGGEAFVVADLAAAAQQLYQLLAEAGAKSAVSWQHELLDRLGLADLLAAPGVTLFDSNRLSALPAAEARETADVRRRHHKLRLRVAETVADDVLASRAGRLASLLPPMHIAIVERQQIVPDLIDAFQLLAECGLDQLPNNVTWITGPSKTGDIELQLTTGVHGPGKWRVIIIP